MTDKGNIEVVFKTHVDMVDGTILVGKLVLDLIIRKMASLECMCGDVFTASCQIEPTGSMVAWLLLLLSVILHAHSCVGNQHDNDDDEPSTMYS